LFLGLWRVLFYFMKCSISILLLFLLLSGCDLFSPREPEPPLDTSDPYAWKPPTSPEIVLENLSNSFPAHKPNYFLDVLSHDPAGSAAFIFLPDPGVASSQPGVFTVWGYTEEESFVAKLFQALNSEGLQRLSWELDQLSPIDDHYEISADYRISLSYSANETQLPALLGGQAILTLIQNTDLLYEVSKWQDLKSDTLSCWTDLKTLVQ